MAVSGKLIINSNNDMRSLFQMYPSFIFVLQLSRGYTDCIVNNHSNSGNIKQKEL